MHFLVNFYNVCSNENRNKNSTVYILNSLMTFKLHHTEYQEILFLSYFLRLNAMSYEDKIFIKNGVCKRFSARIITTRIFPTKTGKNEHWTTFCKPDVCIFLLTHSRKWLPWSSQTANNIAAVSKILWCVMRHSYKSRVFIPVSTGIRSRAHMWLIFIFKILHVNVLLTHILSVYIFQVSVN